MQRSPGFIDHAGKKGLCDGLTERAGEKIVSSFDANVPPAGFELDETALVGLKLFEKGHVGVSLLM